MATIRIAGRGVIPEVLSLANFTFAPTATGGAYTYLTFVPRLGTVTDRIEYVVGSAGQIVSLNFTTFNFGFYTIENLNIPLTQFNANLTNIMPLLTGGSDLIEGGSGTEFIYAGAGNDTVYGRDGDDRLYGDSGNDSLFGGTGDDFLFGGDGNDLLRGDEGVDTLDGGAGTDRAVYLNSNAGVTVSLSFGTVGSGGHAQGDVLTNIEQLQGSNFSDVLTGSSVANTIWGQNGDDQIFGLAGNDVLEGMIGNDAVFGGDGNDRIGGGDGNDGLFGDAGNDTIFGGNGNDYIDGGNGNDVLWGDAGDDNINGGAGNDFLVLGAGNDALTLGAGDDRVRFDYGNGIDTIFDFGNGQDVIDFTATNMTLGALQANSVDTSQGVLMSLGSGSILLSGLSLSQIDWNADFAFA